MAHLSDETEHITYVRAQGFTEEAARRRVEIADRVDDCAHALHDVVSTVREATCVSLDGPFQLGTAPSSEFVCRNVSRGRQSSNDLSRLELAWRDFREAVAETQRIEEGEA